ncbi:hypothetical protein B0H11DRAFT_2267416 [Mycena galericulata]|nr:hypothetical protein B0H11DRAFT_2267416 [Mycena galericulata]
MTFMIDSRKTSLKNERDGRMQLARTPYAICTTSVTGWPRGQGACARSEGDWRRQGPDAIGDLDTIVPEECFRDAAKELVEWAGARCCCDPARLRDVSLTTLPRPLISTEIVTVPPPERPVAVAGSSSCRSSSVLRTTAISLPLHCHRWEQKILRSMPREDFDAIHGVLRLGTKYRVNPRRQRALGHLSSTHPTSLATWDALCDSAPSSSSHPNPQLRFARQLGPPRCVLPHHHHPFEPLLPPRPLRLPPPPPEPEPEPLRQRAARRVRQAHPHLRKTPMTLSPPVRTSTHVRAACDAHHGGVVQEQRRKRVHGLEEQGRVRKQQRGRGCSSTSASASIRDELLHASARTAVIIKAKSLSTLICGLFLTIDAIPPAYSPYASCRRLRHGQVPRSDPLPPLPLPAPISSARPPLERMPYLERRAADEDAEEEKDLAHFSVSPSPVPALPSPPCAHRNGRAEL